MYIGAALAAAKKKRIDRSLFFLGLCFLDFLSLTIGNDSDIG